jgi:hypothetical protein
VVALTAATLFYVSTGASSHREAPLISADPLADNTDFYMFVSPNRPDRVVLVANFIPLEAPYGGPNFYKFDDTALYEILIDNNGDAVEDVTFQFEFRTDIRNQNTFLYNTGPITSIDSPNWNVRQFYTVTRTDGPRRRGPGTVLAQNLPTPPVNVGARSLPDYDSVAAQAVQALPGDGLVFAGQRDDPFFVDLNVFDLLANPLVDGNFFDSLAGFNVHTIAIEVPIASLTANGSFPSSMSDPNAILGAWSTVSRPSVTTRRDGKERTNQNYVQVSRLGQPLVNEVVLPLALKDAFNALEPTGDAVAADYVTDPEVPKLLNALFGINSPPAPRNDLVTIFLTGIPGLNMPANVTPSEMLRLNVAVPPTGSPNPLGVIGRDVQGFPNGRRLGDDVVDIALRAMAGATPLTPSFNVAPNNILGDGINANDRLFSLTFPYLASPHAGNQ